MSRETRSEGWVPVLDWLDAIDYRWEKIVAAVASEEHLGFAEAAEWLIERHPEYPAVELPIIRRTAELMSERRRRASPPPRSE